MCVRVLFLEFRLEGAQCICDAVANNRMIRQRWKKRGTAQLKRKSVCVWLTQFECITSSLIQMNRTRELNTAGWCCHCCLLAACSSMCVNIVDENFIYVCMRLLATKHFIRLHWDCAISFLCCVFFCCLLVLLVVNIRIILCLHGNSVISSCFFFCLYY